MMKRRRRRQKETGQRKRLVCVCVCFSPANNALRRRGRLSNAILSREKTSLTSRAVSNGSKQ